MIQYSKYDSPMSPQSFAGVLHKRRTVILFLFFLIVGVVIAAAFLLPPTYRASARLMINYQIEVEKEHLLRLIQVNDKSYFERLTTEPIIMKMRSVLEPVVVGLGLDKSDDSGESTEAERTRAVETLAKELEVEREKDSNVLLVSYDSSNPALAADIVGRVISEYSKQRPGLERDERAIEFFDNQISAMRLQIDNLEKKGLEYKTREKVLSVDKQSYFMFETLGEYDRRLSDTRATRIKNEARLKIIREQLEKGGEVIIPNTEVGNSGSRYLYVNELSKNLMALEIRKSSLEQKYTANHPELASIIAQIKENRNQIRAAVDDLVQGEEVDIKARMAEERALMGSIAQVVNNVATLSRQEYELGKLTIGVDDLKAVYSMLLRQREEAKIAAGRQEYLVTVKVLESAVVPQHPVKPNRPLWIALGLVLGLVVSFGVAFFMEYFDHSVNTVEDAQNCLGLPILAAISDFQVPMYKPVQPESKSSDSSKV